MAESGLSLGYGDLKTDIAVLLGWSTTAGSRSTAQNAHLDRIIDAGLRMFYNAHRWHFKRVNYTTITTTADDNEDDLPDDFGGFIGDEITITDDAENYHPVKIRTAERIFMLRQRDDTTTGVPAECAASVKAFTGVTGVRHEIIYYPIPDGAYPLLIPYKPHGEALSDSAPYPWSIASVSEAIRAACRCQADLIINDKSDGPNWQYYTGTALPGAIEADNDLTPRNLGQVRDNSDLRQVQKVSLVTSTVTPT